MIPGLIITVCFFIVMAIYLSILYRRRQLINQQKKSQERIKKQKNEAISQYIKTYNKKLSLCKTLRDADLILSNRIKELEIHETVICKKEGISETILQKENNTEFEKLHNKLMEEGVALANYKHEITNETSAIEIERMCLQLKDRILACRICFEEIIKRLHEIIDEGSKNNIINNPEIKSTKIAIKSKLSSEQAALFNIKNKPEIKLIPLHPNSTTFSKRS